MNGSKLYSMAASLLESYFFFSINLQLWKSSQFGFYSYFSRQRSIICPSAPRRVSKQKSIEPRLSAHIRSLGAATAEKGRFGVEIYSRSVSHQIRDQILL